MIKTCALTVVFLLFSSFVSAQTEKLRHDVDSVTALLKAAPDVRLIEEYVLLANKVAYVMPERTGQMASALDEAGRKIGYQFAPNRVRLLNLVAYINVSQFDSANLLLEAMKSSALKLNDDMGLLHYYINKGIVAKRMGKYEQAAQMYYSGLVKADQLNETRYKLALYNNLTALFNAMDQFGKSKQMVFEALKIAEHSGLETVTGIASIYANLAIIYKRTNQWDSALFYYKKAKAGFEKDGNMLVSGTYCNIGILYGALKQYDSAEIYLQKALELTRAFRQVNYEINTLNALAEIRLARSRYDDAIRFATLAKERAAASGGMQAELNALQALHVARARKGDYKEAYRLLREAVVVNDSLYSAEKEAVIGEVKEKYESDKKDEQIVAAGEKIQEQKNRVYYLSGIVALVAVVAGFAFMLYYKTGKLNRKIATQAQAIEAKNEDLARVNQVKDKLFGVVSHDLRAPVSSLHALMSMMNTQQVNAERMALIKDQLQLQLQQTTGLMETLLHWAKTQMQGWEVNNGPVKLAPVAAAVFRQFEKAAMEKRVGLDLQVNDAVILRADEQLVQIILHNLVSNALKFTGENGKVWLEVTEQQGRAQVCVCDTGRGVGPDELETVLALASYRTRAGTAGEKGFGLGLKICKELARQMDGTITATSEKGKGSRFVLDLPIF